MALFEGELGAICHGAIIEPPRFYLVHGVDDDVYRHGASFGTLSDLLQPCRVCVLGYDKEADACASLSELAQTYIQRVVADLDSVPLCVGEEGHGLEHIVLVGYGFGAMIAHQMALQFQESSRRVALVLLDSEVNWPPPRETPDRLGGYPWQGGEVEAALLACRALGATDFVQREVGAFADRAIPFWGAEETEDFMMRAFWEVKRYGLQHSYFAKCIRENAYILNRMYKLEGQHRMPELAFDGPCLLIASTDSPEFRGARDVNGKFCSDMEVVELPGTHYSLCQRGLATSEAGLPGVPTALPQAISEFLLRRGLFGVEAQEAVIAAGMRPNDSQPRKLAQAGFLELVD